MKEKQPQGVGGGAGKDNNKRKKKTTTGSVDFDIGTQQKKNCEMMGEKTHTHQKITIGQVGGS